MVETAPPRTPWHFWLIGVLSLLWNSFGAFDFTATVARFEPYLSQFPQAMLDHVYAQPAFLWAAWTLGVWGAFAGSMLLLMRNKLAVWAFALSLLGAAISLAMCYIAPPPPDVGSNTAMMAVIVLIAALLLAYVIWLARKGVLR